MKLKARRLCAEKSLGISRRTGTWRSVMYTSKADSSAVWWPNSPFAVFDVAVVHFFDVVVYACCSTSMDVQVTVDVVESKREKHVADITTC